MSSDSSSGVQGKPLVLKFEVVRLTLGNMTPSVEVVYPMFTYDSGCSRLIGCRLKWKAGEESRTCWVITSPSLSLRIRARTSWTTGRSFWNSSNRAFWRAASEGQVGVPTSASSASGSLHTLEGVTPSLELLTVA